MSKSFYHPSEMTKEELSLINPEYKVLSPAIFSPSSQKQYYISNIVKQPSSKMHFNTLFLITALPFLVSSSPAQRRAASQATAPSKRAFEFPDGCAFDPKLGNGYIDNAAGDGEGESCFGWPNSGAVTCGGPFDEKESNDVKEAVKQQATKDGQFKTSTVGDWTAAFQLLSTAFDDRDTSGFDKRFRQAV
ncbi:MAG: hypothetical protein Q9167_001316 [Letrouitia subvulpina]